MSPSSIGPKILELVSDGSFPEATSLYKQLRCAAAAAGVHDSVLTPSFLPSLLKASSRSPLSLPFVVQLHCTALKSGLLSYVVAANALLSAYSKHSRPDAARRVFDECPERDAVSWHAMVNCYVTNERPVDAMDVFRGMHFAGCTSKPELSAAVVSVCGRMGCSRLGRVIHARCVRSEELEKCVPLLTALVDMYARCCLLDFALKVFDLMSERNVVSWTAMIGGCVSNATYDMSLDLFRKMWMEGISPNRATLVSVLPACGELGTLKSGKEIHGYVIRHGLDAEQQIVGALLDMYGRCKGGPELALLVHEQFKSKDVVSWSTMMVNSNRSRDYLETLRLFHRMRKDGISPNSVTMLAVVAAILGLSSIQQGKGLHCYTLKSGLLSEPFARNSLIDMYAKCGCLDSSICIFNEVLQRDSVSYSSLIAGYGLQGHGHRALHLFNEMLDVGIEPDGISFLAVLSACNHSGLVDEGKELFHQVRRSCPGLLGLEHYACFIDLLGRAGRIDDACHVLRTMPMRPGPKTLSSLVLACRAQGKFEDAKELALWLIDSEPENAANYTLLSMICSEAGDWCLAEDIRRVMKERGVKKTSGRSQIQNEIKT